MTLGIVKLYNIYIYKWEDVWKYLWLQCLQNEILIRFLNFLNKNKNKNKNEKL